MKFPPVACLLTALAAGGLSGCRQVPVGQTASVGIQKSLPHSDPQNSEADLTQQTTGKLARGERLHTMTDPFLLLTSDVSEPVDEFLVQLTGEIVEYGDQSKGSQREDVAVARPVVSSAEKGAVAEKPAKPATWRQFEPRTAVVIENANSSSPSVATGDFQMPLIIPAHRESVPAVVQPENAPDTSVDVVVPSPVDLPEKPSTDAEVEPSPKGLTVPSFPALPGVTDLGT